MKTLSLATLSLLVSLCASSLLRAQTFPLSENSWSNPDFRERFLGSYGVDTETNPSVKPDENQLIQELIPLVSSNPEAAVLRLQQTITSESNAAFNFILANLYYQEGDMNRAIRQYQEAIRKFPNYYRAYLNLGRAYVSEERFREALPMLQKALEIKPGDGSLYGLIGYCYMVEGRYAVALDSYRMAIILQPESLDWQKGKLSCLVNLGFRQEAVGLLYELIAEEPDSSEYWTWQTNMFQQMDNTEMAAANLEIIREIGQANAPTLAQLGDIYINVGLPELAVERYQEALESGRIDFRRIRNALRILVAREEYDEAEKLIDVARTELAGSITEDNDLELLTTESRIMLARGETTEVEKVLNEIIEKNPLDGEVLLTLADLHRREGDLVKAEYYANQASQIERYRRDALIKLAQIEVGQKSYAEAVTYLRQAQELQYQDHVAEYLNLVEQAANRRL